MMLERRKADTRTTFRSVRYRTIRNNGYLTADSNPPFRITKNSFFETTKNSQRIIQTRIGTSFHLTKNLQKTTYLESFHSLMNTLPLKEQASKNKFWSKQSRVEIKNFVQLEDSQFTTLDEIQKPISYLKHNIIRINGQLKQQTRLVQNLNLQLNQLRNKTNQSLQYLEEHFINSISTLRSVIRKNQVNQTQKKLKTKRQLLELQQAHKNNIQMFNNIHQRSLNMQKLIYNCQPLELKQIEQQYAYQGEYI